MELNIVGGAYTLDNIEIAAQTCVNWVPQVSEIGGGAALIPTAGLVRKYSLDGAIKGMQRISNDWILIAHGEKISRVKGTEQVELGTIGPSTHVTMADNGLVAVVATGAALYAIDLKEWTLTQVTAEGFDGTQYVGFMDGYFIFATPETGRFGWLGLYNTDFDALSYATAEGSPDNIVRLMVVGREMWALGAHSIEVFYTSGGKDMPFTRVGGAFITVGCEAPRTAVNLGNSIIFVARTAEGGRQICVTQGYQAQRISTHCIEQVIKTADITQATAFGYQHNGHGYYVLSLPDIDKTYVFDTLTSMWHERAWRDTAGDLHRYRGQHHAYDGKDNLIGDWQNGNVYALNSKVFTDDGAPVYRERTIDYLPNEKRNVSYLRLELGMSVNASNIDQEVFLTWTDDYTRTWKPPIARPLGKEDDPVKRVIWRKMGAGRQRAFKIYTTATTRCAISAAYIEVQGANA